MISRQVPAMEPEPHHRQPCVCAWEHNQASVSPSATLLHHAARDRAVVTDIAFQNGEARQYLVRVSHRADTGRRIGRGAHRQTLP